MFELFETVSLLFSMVPLTKLFFYAFVNLFIVDLF